MTTTRPRSLNPPGETLTDQSFLRYLTAILFGLAVLIAPAAQAAGTVGTGTAASCTDSALDAALAGGGLVTFNCGGGVVTLTVLTTKVITVNTTLDGGNIITLSGGNARRVIVVTSGALTLQNVTIANGNGGAGIGGGLQNQSTLIVTNSTFTANSAGSGGGAIGNFAAATATITNSTFSSNLPGGAIYNTGTLTVTNSTFSSNVSTFDGAAIFAPGGTLTVNGSTFSGNASNNPFGNGGGAIHSAGTATIINSTFTGNSHSTGPGGAIYSLGGGALVTLLNVTISGNSAVGSGGGFFDGAGNSGTHNSIIANNTPDNCGGLPFPNTSRYNLTSDASCNLAGGIGNLVNTNPLLAGLANNAGPTRTMALNAGSPAIDAGSPNLSGIDVCSTADQRGTPRPQGPGCDIGAFEVIGSNCTLDVDGNDSIDALTDGLMIIRALFGLTGTSVTNNAVGGGATRTTWAQIRPYLNGNCGTSFAP